MGSTLRNANFICARAHVARVAARNCTKLLRSQDQSAVVHDCASMKKNHLFLAPRRHKQKTSQQVERTRRTKKSNWKVGQTSRTNKSNNTIEQTSRSSKSQTTKTKKKRQA